MINVYIVSGFLGSGKTTFIKKLLEEKHFEKLMLIENEFGEVGVDGAFFEEGLKIREINNGCICCSLQGDFADALEEIEDMGVSDLIIEPSGVGKLSEIINVVKDDPDFRIVSHICIVDVKTCKKYHTNFKEYFDDQVKAANAIILSHLDVASDENKQTAIEIIKEINDDCYISTKPIAEYSIDELLDIIVNGGDILPDFDEGEHHHDECHHCHHDEEHEHHHHHHDEEHEHHHEHHHHHHDDDDEDELFKNHIIRTDYVFTKDELVEILNNVDEDIIRIKGYVFGKEGMLYFNYVLNEYNIYVGNQRQEALVSIIGTSIDAEHFEEVFHG
ncbi:MAG: GTP-binding protein [Erysipelotrichaceae bacterium]|nr:GTP-binding protein [Erysipelotrichaceae bacterium]